MKKILLISILLVFWHSSWSQCPATVTITGTYTTTYTGSNSWIASSGTTIIPSGSNVTLDANPDTNGYVRLNAGFKTEPNATFKAVVQTPCPLLGNEQFESNNYFKIYPNPTNSILNIETSIKINKLELFDVNGRKVLNNSVNSETITLNIDNIASGIYLLKVSTENSTKTQKIIKN